MTSRKILIIFVAIAVTLINDVGRVKCLKSLMQMRKPPDPTKPLSNFTGSNVKRPSNEDFSQEYGSNSTELPSKGHNLNDEDELVGQETKLQESRNDITATTTPTTSTQSYRPRAFIKPMSRYHPFTYQFKSKPKANLNEDSRYKLKPGNNSTISESMLKWRSRYNYVYNKRASAPKGRHNNYLTKYKNKYLIKSDSPGLSASASINRNTRYNFSVRSNRLGKYYSNVRSRSGSGGRSNRRNRNNNRRNNRNRGLYTSGSSRSYSRRRHIPSAHSTNVAVPGIPDHDYPIYTIIPKTSFSCDGRVGSFPDYEARCQVWHICYGNGLHSQFLCPNGTLFNPKVSVCDWWHRVYCVY